jgi:Ser/Thr protein kinase RdoA (MazF antagonist)
VRTEAEHRFADAVVGERSQTGGYTPGIASRLELADSRRAFLKAIPTGHALIDTYRTEAAVAACLPTGAPAPHLWWSAEVDGWWLAVFDDIDGAHPDVSAGSAQLPAVVATVAALGDVLTPCPHTTAPPVAAEFRPLFTGWRTLAGQPDAELDAWSAAHLEALAALEPRCLETMTGDTLLHTDLRPDNLMIDRDGRVLVIDWAWPARGAAWVDVAFLVPQLILAGHSPQAAQQAVAEVLAWREVDPGAVTSFAAALTGLWEAAWRTDTNPGLRDYHRRAAHAGRAWTAHRTGWRTPS